MEASNVHSPWQNPALRDRTFFPGQVGKKATGFHRRFRRTLAILSGGFLVAIGCVALLMGISWVRSEAAVGVVRAQVSAIRNGKVEQAYALFSSEYQSGMSLPTFRRWLRRERRLANVQQVELRGRSVWGRTALLWGSFRDDLGHSYSVRYLLIREKGTWRIDSFYLAAEIPDRIPQDERFLYI